MEYIKLGNSDLVVSRICLGCMGSGDATNGMHSWTLDEEKSTEIIKRLLKMELIFLIQQLDIKVERVNSILDVL